MPKRPVARYGCAGKSQFEKRHEAVAVLLATVYKTGANRRQLQVYKCRHCRKFHFGHKPGTRKRR